MSSQKRKRVMTSAIVDLTVADVRRLLGTVRKLANQQTPENPFRISQILAGTNMTVEEFCLKFSLGHHFKRHKKSSKTKTGNEMAEIDNENDDQENENSDQDSSMGEDNLGHKPEVMNT